MASITKQERILALLRDGQSMNRFDGEQNGDHVLPSTIFALRRKGHIFLATPEQVPTRFGGLVRVVRYAYIGQL